MLRTPALGLLLWPFALLAVAAEGTVVNDVTRLNPIEVDRVVAPHSIEEIQQLVRDHAGPISIGGGRYSQGGQTATEGALFLDMREFNRILHLSASEKTLTVQPGITWREIQEAIDPQNLSVKIMQTYSNFTVGGSLSVNVHGRYVGQGPLVRSVRSIKVVLADGTLVACSPTQRADVFYGAIGGYGGIGVIVEATLELADNFKVERRIERVAASEYTKLFFEKIRPDPDATFTNGDIYPPDFDTVNSVTWYRSERELTVADRLIPRDHHYWLQPRLIGWIASLPFGQQLRRHIIDPLYYRDDAVVWRNHEASYDVAELEPPSRDRKTYVLQEYFVPVARFGEFVPKMGEVFRKHDVEVLNVSIRHALPDPGTLLAWARQEVFAFVVYYQQGTGEEDRAAVATWTREMIDAVLSVDGTYYLPYQPHATDEQFGRAYPRSPEYFALKARLDPTLKFRNKLWDKYYPTPAHARRLAIEAIAGYHRPESRTFLTVPEWYIVFNPEEYARHLKDKPPSAFPYFASIAEFWRLYDDVDDLVERRYPTDWGSHLMLMVIGTSYTVELAIKSLYENTIGRLSEWSAEGRRTSEDELDWQYADEYVRFIYVYPWYEFPFWQRLKDFWSRSQWNEEDVRFREIERSVAFTFEYAVKAGYAWLIGLGTQSVYEADAGTIYAIATGAPADPAEVDARLKVLQRFDDGRSLIAVPRYEPFREIVTKLAAGGTQFLEISGNDEIMLTAIGTADWQYDLPAGAAVLDSAIVTDPSRKRFGILVPTRDLAAVLNALPGHGLQLEHVYDY
jgi:FAD/FMN-containing dehydrogenase